MAGRNSVSGHKQPFDSSHRIENTFYVSERKIACQTPNRLT